MIEPGPLASHLLPFFYLRQFYAGLTYQKLSVWRTVEFYRSKDLPNRRRISSDSGEGGMKSAIPEADHDGRSASVFDVAIRPSSKTSSRCLAELPASATDLSAITFERNFHR